LTNGDPWGFSRSKPLSFCDALLHNWESASSIVNWNSNCSCTSGRWLPWTLW
jgi:hypothetical protein